MITLKNLLPGKKKLGQPVGATVSVAGASRKAGKVSPILPYRNTNNVDFLSTLPPNLLSAAYGNNRLAVFRPDYIVVVVSLLVAIASVVYYALIGMQLFTKQLEADQRSGEATAKVAQRAALEKESVVLKRRMYDAQRLFQPASVNFGLSDFLYACGRDLPKEFFIGDLNLRFEPEFYLAGKRLPVKGLDRVDAYAPKYTLVVKLQGVGPNASAEKLDAFAARMQPPAVMRSSGLGLEAYASFEMVYTYKPLVLFNVPGVVGEPVVPRPVVVTGNPGLR